MNPIKFSMLLMASILVSVTLSCRSESTENVIIPMEEVARPVVVVKLWDISSSAEPVISLPDSMQLQQFYRAVSSGNEKNCIVLGKIGITKHSDSEFLRFSHLRIPSQLLEGTMSQRRRIMEYNLKADYLNRKREKEFTSAFMALQNRNDNQTDIATALERSCKLLNEPNFSNHQKVFLIISDGYHITKGRRSFQVDFSGIADLKVILVGWKTDTKGFKGVAPTDLSIFEGYSNVPDYLLTIINSH